jgi:predicted permease
MSEIWRKILFFFRRGRFESELEQEMRFHLEMAAEERGETVARREFGSLVRMREDTRSAWQIRWLEDLVSDLRYGMRALRRSPGFAAAAIFSLALGIGANTAIFTLINALLLRTLPVREPQQLVLVARSDMVSDRSTSFPYPFYRDLRDHNAVFSGVLCYTDMSPSLRVGASPERVTGELVSGNYFDVLGVRPYVGRLFTQEDDRVPGRVRVVVLSFGFWQRRFGADPGIIGRVIHLNTTPMTVIGVTPPGFDGLENGQSIDVRAPMMMQAEMFASAPQLESRGSWWLGIAARLTPGVSRIQAEAAVRPMLFHYAQADGGPSMTQYRLRMLASERIVLDPLARGTQHLGNQFRRALYVLMAIVGVVLLIGCVNIANLLLARSRGRQREIAVRLALGAGRGRLVRQMLTESTLLAALGGVLGIGIAYWGARAVVSFSPQTLTLDVAPDLSVLLFTLAVSMCTGLLFGLAPAIQSTRVSVTPELKGGDRSAGAARLSFGQILISVQVALSLVLLTGAGLFARSLHNLRTMDTGFDRRNIVVVKLDPRVAGYSAEQTNRFYGEVRSRVEAMPGVRAVSYAVMGLVEHNNWGSGIRMEGYTRPEGDRGPLRNFVGPGYFHTAGNPIVMGRDFTAADTGASPHVAVVNEKFARFYFGKENPIGRRIGAEGGKEPADYAIVGVAKDGKYASLREETPRYWYIPYEQYPMALDLHLYVRTVGDAGAMTAALRRTIQDLDRNVLISDIKTLETQVDEDLNTDRLLAALATFFSLLATVLASIGLYGVMAYAVARRTRDRGIRMALGAERSDVLWLVLRQAMALVAIGIVIGVPVTLALARLVSSLLFGLQANDPVVLTLAGVTLAVVAAVASYLPAWRASRLDPMRALRYE